MKIKFLITAMALATVIQSCSNNDKADEKKQQDEVIKVHDKVMGDSEVAMKNHHELDSLLKNQKIQDTSGKVTAMIQELGKADEAMENWMHQFNPDYTGKSHTQVMEYLHSQRLQIERIDSTFKSAIDRSSQYLVKIKHKK